MTVKGRGGIGSHKHGVSGTPGKSPALRHLLKIEAEGTAGKVKPKKKRATSDERAAAWKAKRGKR